LNSTEYTNSELAMLFFLMICVCIQYAGILMDHPQANVLFFILMGISFITLHICILIRTVLALKIWYMSESSEEMDILAKMNLTIQSISKMKKSKRFLYMARFTNSEDESNPAYFVVFTRKKDENFSQEATDLVRTILEKTGG
jgi:hypothetical protein